MFENMDFKQYHELLKTKHYDENCIIVQVLEKLSGKWRLRILFELSKKDSFRFGELKKVNSPITNTMLTTILKDFEEEGLISRTQHNEIPPHVDYALTEKGLSLLPLFFELIKWADKFYGMKES